jgi:hypothetical protein
MTGSRPSTTRLHTAQRTASTPARWSTELFTDATIPFGGAPRARKTAGVLGAGLRGYDDGLRAGAPASNVTSIVAGASGAATRDRRASMSNKLAMPVELRVLWELGAATQLAPHHLGEAA